MAQSAMNNPRFDPYKNFKFRVKWDGRDVVGINKVMALERTPEVIEHRSRGDRSASSRGMQALARLQAWSLLIFSLVGISSILDVQPGYAIGPTLPLAFEDVDEQDPEKVVLRVDPRQIRLEKIERHLYSNGERLKIEVIDRDHEKQREKDGNKESSDDRGTFKKLIVPFRFKGIEELKPGLYAQKIVIEGRWMLPDAAKPLFLQRWLYFMVKDGHVAPVDLEKYSNMVDRAEVTISSTGKQALVHGGRDFKSEVPLPKTKSGSAIPLGQLGGALEERLPGERMPKHGKSLQEEIDRSELNEK
jgi:hypothetical protein